MLKTMRKNVKALAPTLWIVIATFVISIFAIWGGAGRLGEKSQEDTIAFMGKDHITTDSYFMALRNRLEAREMGITASSQEIRDRIVSLFQRDGKFIGFNEYRQILEYNRMSLPQFENGLKEEIILNKLIQLLTAGITATQEELWENYRKQKDSAKIEYLN